MPGTNVTLDNTNPRIIYGPQWRDGDKTLDPLGYRYSDDGTFKVTTEPGATMRFTFNGTAIWLFGAKRNNHGKYSVTLDGESKGELDGFGPEEFAAVLFSAEQLPHGSHTITLTNIPTNGRPYVDIDFITYTAHGLSADEVESILTQDTEAVFSYTPESAWSSSSSRLQSFNGSNGHITDRSGASVTCNFVGDSVAIYGSIGPEYGQYSVSVDGRQESSIFNASNAKYYSQVMLYEANSLGSGSHSIVLTSRPERPGQVLSIDYAVITKFGKSSSSLSAGAIAGIAVGAVLGVGLIIGLAIFWWLRQRKSKSGINGSPQPVTPFPPVEPFSPNALYQEASNAQSPLGPGTYSSSPAHTSSPPGSQFGGSEEKRPVTLSVAPVHRAPGSSTSSQSAVETLMREPGREIDAGPLPPSYQQATFRP